eukprot:scaffold36777_cov199-Amphora_coffeaeformis.AAC.5
MYETSVATDVEIVFDDGTCITVHRLILIAHSRHLAGVFRDDPTATRIHVGNDDRRLFKLIIDFLYQEILPDDFDVPADALSILKLCDKHGFVDLKMLMESRIVQTKAAELAVVAQSHNCALLKEAAIKFISDDLSNVMGKDGWNDLLKWPELVNDVFYMQATRARPSYRSGLDSLGVAALRSRAASQGLDVDGSRESLVKRLNQNNERK